MVTGWWNTERRDMAKRDMSEKITINIGPVDLG